MIRWNRKNPFGIMFFPVLWIKTRIASPVCISVSWFYASFSRYTLFTNPSTREGYDKRSIFKLSLAGLNSEFSFSSTSCLTKAEEISLSYYLPIAGGRIIGFVPLPRVLREMQSVSSWIWTRVAVSISYDNNHYTTGIPHFPGLYIHLLSLWLNFNFWHNFQRVTF